MNNDDIAAAYDLIHDRLSDLPLKYCCWKAKNPDGSVSSHTLEYYRNKYIFLVDNTLSDNLGQLRMCLDYQHSLLKLHKPGLIFKKQHIFVICQLCASICEGLLFDVFENVISERSNHRIFVELVKQKTTSSAFGLGQLIDVFSKSRELDKDVVSFLGYLNHIRNTIHPRSFSADTVSFEANPVVNMPADDIISKLDEFTEMIHSKYYTLEENIPF